MKKKIMCIGIISMFLLASFITFPVIGDASDNSPPTKPTTPVGVTKCSSNSWYYYITNATDPDGDDIEIGWDFNGDAEVDEWNGDYEPDYEGGVFYIQTYLSAPGTYDIQAIARDTNEQTSEWSDPLTINVYDSHIEITKPETGLYIGKQHVLDLQNELRVIGSFEVEAEGTPNINEVAFIGKYYVDGVKKNKEFSRSTSFTRLLYFEEAVDTTSMKVEAAGLSIDFLNVLDPIVNLVYSQEINMQYVFPSIKTIDFQITEGTTMVFNVETSDIKDILEGISANIVSYECKFKFGDGASDTIIKTIEDNNYHSFTIEHTYPDESDYAVEIGLNIKINVNGETITVGITKNLNIDLNDVNHAPKILVSHYRAYGQLHISTDIDELKDKDKTYVIYNWDDGTTKRSPSGQGYHNSYEYTDLANRDLAEWSEGTYAITVTVVDEHGAESSDTFQLEISKNKGRSTNLPCQNFLQKISNNFTNLLKLIFSFPFFKELPAFQ